MGQNILKMSDEEHKKYHTRILYVLIVILIVFFGGATFYHYVEKWRYLDALYFSAATMTTVGYGDISPRTDTGKVFTIFFVFMGVGIALYGISLIAAHFVEMREKFWLEQLGKIKIKHPQTFLGKLKKLFFYKSEEITEGYEKSRRK